MNYLIDTSAFVRILRRQASKEWQAQVSRGMVVVCEPVICEAMVLARASDYPLVLTAVHDTYPWVPVPDNAWDAIRQVRALLAQHNLHQGLSVADYLVVVTALHHRLVVLHDDPDFIGVAAVLPEFRQHRIIDPAPA